ncbi:MAG: hypothetical protein BroJett026_36540 [Betaproteobacteria bacterium]|nr:MAG: hypothetical protein BroJett026_36540 [Betaproteobacteria bacterium]
MSIARHHVEWLKLVEVSGPFLSLPVLMRTLPQGLDAHDVDFARELRLAFDEWEDASTEPAIHNAWIDFVRTRGLEWPDSHWLVGQALPPGLDVRTEHGEALRPSGALKGPDEALPSLLFQSWPAAQDLEAPVPSVPWKAASPATRMMTLLHGTGVPLGLVTNGEQWMLVAAMSGEATTFASWSAGLWGEEPLTLRAFRTLLGVRRFFAAAPEDRLPALLEQSRANQQEVTDQLGLQVRHAVELLVQALDRIDQDRQRRLLAGVNEKVLYQAALTVMMRLVFLFSAEERKLLLLGDPLYDRHYAVSTLREQLHGDADRHGLQVLERRHDAWSRLLATFRLVYGGSQHDRLTLPAYGGALFDPDRYPFLEGRPPGTRWRAVTADPLPVSNRAVLHLLDALQVLQVRVPGGPAEPRRLSFRALDIEQIGHVYEGLLDHTAVRATTTMVGLAGGDEPEVALDDIEARAAEGEASLVAWLKEATGRSANALRNLLRESQIENPHALAIACGNNPALVARVTPYAGLLREDPHELPVVIAPGSVFVTAGADRRSTGTHYTPRALTERVVAATLDPLVYEGVGEGETPAQERLKSPEAILALKVCDPACGSGAFLVQACRYLSERLVEAWDRAERAHGLPLRIPEASTPAGHPSETLLPRDTEERLALARRLVAERCLYGVDVNPMAVEMAKLSLWLVTLHRHRPFTFLDHAIKCGDSLLGLVSGEQVETFHLRPERARAHGRILDYVAADCAALLARARARRQSLEAFTVLDVGDAERKAELHREAEAAADAVERLADLVVGAGLGTAAGNASSASRALDVELGRLAVEVSHAWPRHDARLAAEPDGVRLGALASPLLARRGTGSSRRPFHWLSEFPEVFLRGEEDGHAGFDAIVSNPPFVGGQKITGLLGTDYRDYLVLHVAGARRGSADLCAYFFLRVMELLRPGGNAGLLAVNTIAEGDTRQVGLEAMLKSGHAIYAAWPNFAWPGAAAVVASEVHLTRGPWRGRYALSGIEVPTISPFLSGEDEWSPKPLAANANKAFQGSIVLGLGFTMSEADAQALIARNAKNAEALFPYLNGEDLNSHPEQKPSRWVINFWDWPLDRSARGSWADADVEQRDKWLREGRVPSDYPGPVAADFPDLLAIVEAKVKPERDRLSGNASAEGRKKRWWLYGRDAKSLYHAIGRGGPFARHPDGWHVEEVPLQRVVACSLVSKHLAYAFRPRDEVFAHRLAVFAFDDDGSFALLASSINEVWSRKNSSSLETRLNYSPSDAFETLPMPPIHKLNELGRAYDVQRSRAMASLGIGLTDLYNRLHNSTVTDASIADLRALRVQIDVAVRDAYGWRDLDLDLGFHEVPYLPSNDRMRFTVSEPARLEILRRLSKLNRDRFQAEQQASAPSAHEPAARYAAKPKRRVKRDTSQPGLPFGEPAE